MFKELCLLIQSSLFSHYIQIHCKWRGTKLRQHISNVVQNCFRYLNIKSACMQSSSFSMTLKWKKKNSFHLCGVPLIWILCKNIIAHHYGKINDRHFDLTSTLHLKRNSFCLNLPMFNHTRYRSHDKKAWFVCETQSPKWDHKGHKVKVTGW